MEEQKMIRILLVGIGGYGSNYIKEAAERDIPGVRIEGIVDVLEGLEETYPYIRENRIPIYRDLRAFYKEHDAELAVISTPIHLHYEQIRSCLKAGSNVLTEKPVCTSVEDARRLEQTALETGHFISVGYQMNYARDILTLKQEILDGNFGRPIEMRCLHAMRRGEKYYHRSGWAGRITVTDKNGNNPCSVNDSPFNNACAHHFQLMTFLLGDRLNSAAELSEVWAEPYKANRNIENFDLIGLKAVTASGVPLFYYTAHCLEETKLGPFAEYRFEKGSVYFGNLYRKEDFIYIGNDGEVRDYGRIDKGERLQKLYDAIEACRNGTAPVSTVQCAIPHLQAVEKIARMPIREIPEDRIEDRSIDGDCFHLVKDIAEILKKSYLTRTLPSENGLAW